jgi:hypothetical protein
MPLSRRRSRSRILRHQSFLVLCCVVLGLPCDARSQQSCTATPLSQRDAQLLLRAIPDALGARAIGGKISLVEWAPRTRYRTESFFFYEILSTKSTETTPLDNGVLGYFGVNKLTGEVVQLSSQEPSVQGKELGALQRRLRRNHCIGNDLVLRNRDLPLER